MSFPDRNKKIMCRSIVQDINNAMYASKFVIDEDDKSSRKMQFFTELFHEPARSDYAKLDATASTI